MYRKEVVKDHETRDYAMYLDGELVGFGRTYREAVETLDQLEYQLICGQHYNPEADALTTAIITTMVRAGLSDPPPDDAPGDDCPDHGPYDDDCPKCRHCSKAHHTWRCPEIYTLLFAEPVVMVMDVDYSPVGWPV